MHAWKISRSTPRKSRGTSSPRSFRILPSFRSLRLSRELVPAFVLMLALGVMLVPLFGGAGSISGLREEVVELRRAYNRAGMLMLQHRLAEYHTGSTARTMSYREELPEIDPRLRQVGRFFADVETELDGIDAAIQVVRRAMTPRESGSPQALDEWTVEELENWTVTMQELDLRFSSLLDHFSGIESARNQAYSSVGLFGILLAVLFVMLYLRQSAKLELVAHDQLDRRRIALLTHRVQEDERRALARDLHDGTAQELAIARMAADKVKDDATRSIIEGSLTRAIDEIRLLARRMRPMPESYDSPAEMIRELCDYFESRYDFRFELDLDRRIRLNWGGDAVVHLYRIVQESLSNIVRHADASSVHVCFWNTGGTHMELTIQDNGVGLHGAEDGFGTQGMLERAELLCASFSRYSPPEGGTVVRLEFDVDLEHCR